MRWARTASFGVERGKVPRRAAQLMREREEVAMMGWHSIFSRDRTKEDPSEAEQ